MTRPTLGAKCGVAPGTCQEPPIQDTQDGQDAPDTHVQMHHGVRVCVCVCVSVWGAWVDGAASSQLGIQPTRLSHQGSHWSHG